MGAGVTRRALTAARLLVRWYLTPLGMVTALVVIGGITESIVLDSPLGVAAAALLVSAVIVPYRLARERRARVVAGRKGARASRARARRADRKVLAKTAQRIAAERSSLLASLEVVRGEARDIIWSERQYWRASLDELEATIVELRAILGTDDPSPTPRPTGSSLRIDNGAEGTPRP